MSELIDRQEVIDRLKKAEDVFRQNGAKLEANGIHYALELVESDIEIPTIEQRKERPQGDLISREALKDIEYINKGNFNSVEGIWKWIDNAPAVEAYTEEEVQEIREEVAKEFKDIIDDATTVDINQPAIWWNGYDTGKVIGEHERPQDKWIPITYRPMTEEEVKRVETYFGLPLDDKDKKCFSCPMPEHGQEILISTKWGVSKDICLYDCDEGFSLDERGDWEDVDAWMPLPEKYDRADIGGENNGR